MDYYKLPDWVAKLKPVNKKWSSFEVEIITYSSKITVY